MFSILLFFILLILSMFNQTSNSTVYIFEEFFPSITEIQQSKVIASSVGETKPVYNTCYEHPDRFNWMKYAEKYDWPLDELAYIIHNESGGDLCAINPTSGASCWIQQYPTYEGIFNPETCMYQGYKKWKDGNNSFKKHWYDWWE